MWDVCRAPVFSLDSSRVAYAWNQPTFSRYVLQKCSRSATVAPPSRFSAAHSSSRKWRYAPVARCSGVPESGSSFFTRSTSQNSSLKSSYITRSEIGTCMTEGRRWWRRSARWWRWRW